MDKRQQTHCPLSKVYFIYKNFGSCFSCHFQMIGCNYTNIILSNNGRDRTQDLSNTQITLTTKPSGRPQSISLMTTSHLKMVAQPTPRTLCASNKPQTIDNVRQRFYRNKTIKTHLQKKWKQTGRKYSTALLRVV